MAIRLATRDDAKALSEFLIAQFAADPTSGGDPSMWTPEFTESVIEANEVWLGTDSKGRIQGVIAYCGEGMTTITTENALARVDTRRSTNVYNLLVVDYSLSHNNRLAFSKGLSAVTVNQHGIDNRQRDLIYIIGPKASKGGEWAEALGCKDISDEADTMGQWVLPFADILPAIAGAR